MSRITPSALRIKLSMMGGLVIISLSHMPVAEQIMTETNNSNIIKLNRVKNPN